MAHPYWPLFDLRVRTPRLELRLPTESDVLALAELAAQGIHDPETMPFEIPWTDRPSPELERGVLQWNWRQLGTWEPGEWHLGLAVVERETDRVVGVQDLSAEGFRTLRSVYSGSWLGAAHQGRGIGREMRAAMLRLAFDGLGARRAISAAWHDNEASMRVSRSLGYRENGDQWAVRRGVRTRMISFALDREDWSRRDDIEIEGLAPCLPLFGLGNRVAGVDGCKGGWVVATVDDAGATEVEVLPDFAALVFRRDQGDIEAIAVDIPIGLPSRAARQCDIEARKRLGRRASSVFPCPARPVLGSSDYQAALEASRRSLGTGLSKQAWNLVPKMAEVDGLLRPGDQESIVEVHPELVFAALAGEPLGHPKRSPEGAAERIALLEPHVRNAAELAAAPPRGAARDDVLDALAAAVTARALLRGDVERLGGGERDERGLTMEIVAPRSG